MSIEIEPGQIEPGDEVLLRHVYYVKVEQIEKMDGDYRIQGISSDGRYFAAMARGRTEANSIHLLYRKDPDRYKIFKDPALGIKYIYLGEGKYQQLASPDKFDEVVGFTSDLHPSDFIELSWDDLQDEGFLSKEDLESEPEPELTTEDYDWVTNPENREEMGS